MALMMTSMTSMRASKLLVAIIASMMVLMMKEVAGATTKPAPPDFEVEVWEKWLFAGVLVGFIVIAGVNTSLKIRRKDERPQGYPNAEYLKVH